MSDTCPTCGQTWPEKRSGRICADCSIRIGGHHKWFFGKDGRPRHRDCNNPTSYPNEVRSGEQAVPTLL